MKANEAKFFSLLGQIYRRQGRSSEAIDAWNRASPDQSNNQGYCKECAMVYRNVGNFAAA